MRPMQELVTEYCWGAVWTREGLDRRTRSLLNLGMLTALGKSQELGAHVRGALTNGGTESVASAAPMPARSVSESRWVAERMPSGIETTTASRSEAPVSSSVGGRRWPMSCVTGFWAR